ncbi:hypothetical protein N6H18_17110 [Reichenbachiella agarivorans]|uniref:Uncharacterized protein n=1 Tax=Reichenbachiella agarivorans TaxID=2979464 RepID=A0ABY6CNG4_9BACT|nr:hypothetical protein [Reichenbachiella agarivorans]UXP32064.1 hypothetical protein N6H18_17110 [Reichenbachiella agarivorans]
MNIKIIRILAACFALFLNFPVSFAQSVNPIVWQSVDFQSEGFYVDQYTGQGLLAIRPDEKNSTSVSATATHVFDGVDGYYDIVFHGVGENDGSSSFFLFVNGQAIGGEIRLPLNKKSWEVGDSYNAILKSLKLEKGDEISVRGVTHSADGKEWSRARWLKLNLSLSDQEPKLFVERGGVLLIEAEETELRGDWRVVQSFDEQAAGEGHLEFVGDNSYGIAANQNTLRYTVQVTNPGLYQVKWKSRNGKEAERFDERNDSWLRVNADAFLGTQRGLQTDLTGDFAKMWVQDLQSWSWDCYGEHHGVNGMQLYAEFEEAGIYTIEVCGRSQYHPIDQILLFKVK